jgi:hypothetical protein
MWTLRGRIEWSKPTTLDDFEHDLAGGSGPGMVMLVMLGVLVAALIWWTPGSVVVPQWLILVLLVVLLFFPARWLIRRPWLVVANTQGAPGEGAEELSPERWMGSVRGVFSIRQATAKIARDIEVYSVPASDGPLQLID